MKKLRKVISVILSVVMAVTSLLTLCAYASTANLRYFERGVLTDGQNTAYYLIDKDNRTLYLTGDGVTNARTPDSPTPLRVRLREEPTLPALWLKRTLRAWATTFSLI